MKAIKPKHIINQDQNLCIGEYYSCPKCGEILYKNDEQCEKCEIKLEWNN